MREIKLKVWNKAEKCFEELDGHNLYFADRRIYEVFEDSHGWDYYFTKNDVSDNYELWICLGNKDENGEDLYEQASLTKG